MSIYATILSIEDERQWMAELQAVGIKSDIIRDGGPDFDDLDAPIIYRGSHVLPEESHARGGSVEVALIPGHVRFWREKPDAPSEDEPEGPPEPYLRLSVHAHGDTDGGLADATVVLTQRQATRLRDALNEWLDEINESD